MTGRPALRTLCTPSPGHVSAGRAPDPALSPAAPPPSCAAPSRTPGPKRPAKRGGARGADWWIQKFKPNSSEGAPRTGKGRRHPVAREWAGWVGQRMASETGRNWKAERLHRLQWGAVAEGARYTKPKRGTAPSARSSSRSPGSAPPPLSAPPRPGSRTL